VHIIIKKHYLLYQGYKIKCSIGKSGTTLHKKEGDLATPKGEFKLGRLYYRKDRIKSLKFKMNKRIIKKNMGWCNDPKSKSYNREIRFPFNYKAEKLYRRDNIYDILINIKYNYSPKTNGRGSAIFLHIAKKNYEPTEGCIAIKKKDLLKILPMINKNTKILIN